MTLDRLNCIFSTTDRGCVLLLIVSDLFVHYLVGNSEVEVTGW